ncbi:hypothetical protein BGX20_006444 [Mortierella sp. AD010]|nr:hypothetical protein BGX20_006444 [Mortierella sp. AD010]
MKMVDKICSDHGLVFRDRIVYVDKLTVRLVGEKTSLNPVTSNLEERKKNQKQKGHSSNKWTAESSKLGMTQEDIGIQVDKFKVKVEETEKEVKLHRRELNSKLRNQTLAHTISGTLGSIPIRTSRGESDIVSFS